MHNFKGFITINNIAKKIIPKTYKISKKTLVQGMQIALVVKRLRSTATHLAQVLLGFAQF
jgi:hypothetical protein